MQEETLFEKIKSLPPERVAEVEDFVDFLAQRSARSSIHQAIAAYAAEHAGSEVDLDSELEAASLESLNAEEEARQ
jgi:Protein of unknown function (DUF2281)